MAEVKDALTSSDIANLLKSKGELDKSVGDVKKEDENAKEYKDLIANLNKKGPDIKKFLDVGQKHVSNTSRNSQDYKDVRKDLTDLVNQAKKAINAMKAAKVKTEKDALKEGHIAVLAKAKEN